MPEISFEVYCSCGNGLCRQTDVKGSKVYIEPCEKCLQKAKDEGYESGYDNGYDIGYSAGEKEEA